MKSRVSVLLLAVFMLFSWTEKEPEDIDDLFFDDGQGIEKVDYSVFFSIYQARYGISGN